MNKKQLQKLQGKYLRLRPQARGSGWEAYDDEWLVESADDQVIRLVNRRTNDSVAVGTDAVFDFTADPQGATAGIGFLQLHVQIIERSNGALDLEPLPSPRATTSRPGAETSNRNHAEHVALGVAPARSEHRATIRRFRELVAKVHQLKSRPGESRSITSLLTREADFFDLKPYLSDRVKNVLFGSGDGAIHAIVRLGAPPGAMDPVLYAMLDDIEALEVEWGLRSAPSRDSADAPQPHALPPRIPALEPFQKAAHDLHDWARAEAAQVQQIIEGRAGESAKPSDDPAPPLARKPVSLGWREEVKELRITATNHLADVIEDFKLFVLDVLKYSKEHDRFVYVPELHESGPFVELQLWRDEAKVGWVTKLFSGAPVAFEFLHQDATGIWFRGRTADASVKQYVIRELGVWKVHLRYEFGGRREEVDLTFEWHDRQHTPRAHRA